MQNVPILEIVISIVCLVIIVEIVYIVVKSKKSTITSTHKNGNDSIVYSTMDTDITPFIVSQTIINNEVIYTDEIIEESGYSPVETIPAYPSEEDWTPCQPEPAKAEDNWFLASDFSEVSDSNVSRVIDTYTPPSESISYSTDSGSSDSYTTSAD